MTDLLEKAVEAVRRLAPEAQDEIARAMLQLAEDEEESGPIAPEDLAAVQEALAEVDRGEFASDEEVEAAFRRFDP